MKVIPETSRAH